MYYAFFFTKIKGTIFRLKLLKLLLFLELEIYYLQLNFHVTVVFAKYEVD